MNNLINNLPTDLNKLIIYTYPCDTVINNLPPALNEMRLYIWEIKKGITMNENDNNNANNNDKCENNNNYWYEYNKQYIRQAIYNLKKIPFGCDIFINDELINEQYIQKLSHDSYSRSDWDEKLSD